jgi:threonine/homoserine/homoserine lactone efflux protein
VFMDFVASAIWPLFSGDKIVWNIVLAWIFSMGVLSLIIACTLLFSKTSANEFAEEWEKQAGYKKALRSAFAILLLIAAMAATLNDIYNLLLAP